MILKEEHDDLATALGPMRTHIFRPAGEGRRPGIVLFSEIFQATGPIRRTAAFLAGHGYLVAVPEVYHEFLEPGCVLGYDQAGADRGNALKVAKTLASYDADARAALDRLAADPGCSGRLGVMGMCLGGHLAFRAAREPDVRSAACFYATDLHKRSLGAGASDDTLATCARIKGELLLVFGRQDPHIPPEGRRAIHDAVSAAGLTFNWHEFNGQHAFLRDEGHRYDPALARLSHHLVLDLFERNLARG
jgi:carboxymethylenebutenolidase